MLSHNTALFGQKKGICMARKESITKDIILSAAFDMTKEQGIQSVTARRLADFAGCSTQPIFRLYKGMDELYDELYEIAIVFFSEFYINFPKEDKTPFVNLGLAYIGFAQTHPKIFELLFLGEKRNNRSLYELLNGTTQALVKEISKAKEEGARDPSGLFMKMWIFIHGAACMVITGEYDLASEQTRQLLIDSYVAYKRG